MQEYTNVLHSLYILYNIVGKSTLFPSVKCGTFTVKTLYRDSDTGIVSSSYSTL